MNAVSLRRAAVAALAVLGLVAGPVRADPFPSRPVRIVTPFAVGSGPEVTVRMLAEKLQQRWGQPVIVESKPGASGTIAIDAWKRGATDGHDLLQLENVHLVAAAHLYARPPYDAQRDFEPLLPLFRNRFFVTVGSASPYRSMADLIADAKRRPGRLNYGSWSVGNPGHLGSEQLRRLTDTDMVHVVYKETAQLYAAVASGELDFALGTSGTAGALQRAGRIRYLAVAAQHRVPAFPDVPTVAESGGPAGFEVTGWTALVAPKGLPAMLLDRIRGDVAAALTAPDVLERYTVFGYDPFPASPGQFDAFMREESQHYAAIVRAAGIRLD